MLYHRHAAHGGNAAMVVEVPHHLDISMISPACREVVLEERWGLGKVMGMI